MKDVKNLRVAIVCDWLTGIGGAERVVYELHQIFPNAPIYTSQYDPNNISWFRSADVRTGWLQKIPPRLKKFLPVLRAVYFSTLRLEGYDVVISSSGAEAKAVKTGKGTIHVCFMHAPTHYYWSRYNAYIKDPGFGSMDWLARFGLRVLVGPLRWWDKRAAKQPNYIIANSTHTQSEIKRYYSRDSEVIYPPVDIERFKQPANSQFSANDKAGSGFVVAGRMTPYKKIDLAIRACTRLNLPLTVIGSGPDERKLKKLAGPTITFTGSVSDPEVVRIFRSATAFIFPGVDDFGIVAVEALAAGTPVIAFRAGGALDYVVPGKTGEFFTSQTVKSLARALENFKPQNYDSETIKQEAAQYSVASFKTHIQSYLQGLIN